MFKPIYHASSWILFISALLIVSCLAFRCIHDEIDEINEQKTRFTRSPGYVEFKAQRERNPELFEPLDIHFYVDGIAREITSNTFHNIRLALDEVKKFIRNTFQVRKRKKPYLIERYACTTKWMSGMNRGKCSAYKNDSEKCDSNAITYLIPDRYLDVLEVFDFDKPQAILTKPSGPGLTEANFIAFVTFRNEKFCKQDVIAYGSYCRLSKKTQEPLSGILNLCPQAFSGATVSYRYYYNVILHELFHTLGFSLELFDRFNCDKGHCPNRKNIIQEDHFKNYRLMFPSVVKCMQDHFGCKEPWFGAPMALKETANATDKPAYSAHWHPVLMHSSIMTPSLTESPEMLIDNITLSVFAETGWYHVNFSMAENFKFGAEQGCNFGLNGTCDGRFLCNPSEHKTYGCDVLHESIGECENITVHHPCGVYTPNKMNCERSISKKLDVDFHFLGFKQKCFFQELPDKTTEPICLPVQCKTESSYNILINSTWFPCYKKEKISGKNITVLCPDGVLFCPTKKHGNPSPSCPAHLYFFVAVRMYFERPSFEDLVKNHNFKNFKVTTIKQIANTINIPENYIANASLSVFKQIYLDFAICPPPDLNAKELNSILHRVQTFLLGHFVFILKGTENQFIASNDIKIDPVQRISFSDEDGFRSLIIFPVVCAIFLIASFIASVLRLILLQKHRPRRANEKDDIQLSGVKPL